MSAEPTFEAALAHHQAGDLRAAEPIYRALLACGDDLRAMKNLGLLLDDTWRSDEARPLHERRAALAPENPGAQYSLAHHYRRTRALEAAATAYRRTLALQPNHPTAELDLALCLLGMGDYAAGWPAYEARPTHRNLVSMDLPRPEWLGEPLAGKRLLVIGEQGFGDQFMMARFLPQLEGAQITYAGLPALRRLFAPLPVTYFEGVVRKSVEMLEHDYWVTQSSLPGRLGVALGDVASPPYLWGQPRASGARIGLMVQGQPANTNQRYRTLSPEAAKRLLSLPGVISLAPEDTGAKDFQDTADIIAGLDLVLSVDTGVAHLAGAMGHPLWVMLPAHGLDWQWLRERTDSPWYPSARLFRQSRTGDWDPVVDTVIEELGRAGLVPR